MKKRKFTNYITIYSLICIIGTSFIGCSKSGDETVDGGILTTQPHQSTAEPSKEPEQTKALSPFPAPQFGIDIENHPLLNEIEFILYENKEWSIAYPLGWWTSKDQNTKEISFRDSNGERIEIHFFAEQLMGQEVTDSEPVQESVKEKLDSYLEGYKEAKVLYEPEVVVNEDFSVEGYLLFQDKETNDIFCICVNQTEQFKIIYSYRSKEANYELANEIMSYMAQTLSFPD